MASGRHLLSTAVLDGAVDRAAMARDRFSDKIEPPRGIGSAVSVFGHHRIAGKAPGAAQPGLPVDRPLMPPRASPARIWEGLQPHVLPPETALRSRLIVTHRDDPVGNLFDILRTRLVQALEERGWSRVGVCAPTDDCGASFVAANLALSLARRPSARVLLVDMDLRAPRLAGMFGADHPGSLRDVLTGAQPMESHLMRMGANLALALNARVEADSAELLQEPVTCDTLDQMHEDLAPDVVIYDLPPVLRSDDVLAFLPQLDGVLLVADGTRTRAEHIRECERLFTDRTQLLGVVLNRAEDSIPGHMRRA